MMRAGPRIESQGPKVSCWQLIGQGLSVVGGKRVYCHSPGKGVINQLAEKSGKNGKGKGNGHF